MASPSAPGASNRVDALSSLRFVSALAILVYHLFAADKPPMKAAHPLLVHAVEALFVATSFFFVLSGFVLTIAYERQVRAGSFRPREFLFRRIARLYPAFLVGLAAIVLTFAAFPVPALQGEPRYWGWDAASKLLLLHAWIPRFTYTWNYPSWAVSTVVFFYVAFALGFRWFARLSLRRAVTVGVLAYGASIAAVIAYMVLAPRGLSPLAVDDYSHWTIRMKCWPLLRLPEFVVGAATGRIFLARAELGLDERLGRRLVVGGAVISVVGLLLAGFLPYLVMHNLVLVLPFAGIILGIALAHRSPGLRVLSSPRLVGLGDATYSILILQAAFIVLLWETGIGRWEHPAAAVGVRLVTIALIVAAAVLSRKVLELPVIHWVEKKDTGLVGWIRGSTPRGGPAGTPARFQAPAEKHSEAK